VVVSRLARRAFAARALSMMVHALALLALGPVAAGAAPADVIPPGSHAVEHTLVLETPAEVDGLRLVAAPVRGFGGVEQIEQGVPFHFSSKYGTRLYAVPADGEAPPFVAPFDREEGSAAAELWASFPTWSVPVGEVGHVSDSNPLARVETRLAWSGPEGDVRVVGERRWGGDGELLSEGAGGAHALGVPVFLAVAAALGLAGLVVVAVIVRR